MPGVRTNPRRRMTSTGRIRARAGERWDHRPVVAGDVAGFGRDVAARLRDVFGADLVGVYFVGSVALDDYVPGQSDIDMVAVTAGVVSDIHKRRVVDEVSYPNLAGPSRGLELVLYTRRSVSVASSDAAFELNLNTGPRMARRVTFAAADEPRFWFVIDRAIAHLSGMAVDGPPAADVFAPVAREVVLEMMSESIAWHRAHQRLTPSSVLNACRSWRYAEQGELGSKTRAAEWALSRSSDPETIETALRMRGGATAELPEARIAAIVDRAEAALAAARRSSPAGSA